MSVRMETNPDELRIEGKTQILQSNCPKLRLLHHRSPTLILGSLAWTEHVLPPSAHSYELGERRPASNEHTMQKAPNDFDQGSMVLRPSIKTS